MALVEMKALSNSINEAFITTGTALPWSNALVKTAESAGVFVNSSGEQVRVSDHIYVVGGAVRNFVIGAPVKDIDIVIDAIALSTRRAKREIPRKNVKINENVRFF